MLKQDEEGRACPRAKWRCQDSEMPKSALVRKQATSSSPARRGAIAAAAAILRHLSRTEGSIGANAVARELSLAPGTCTRIMKTLLAEGLIEFDVRLRTYSLGSGAISIARRDLNPLRALTRIGERLEETAHTFSIVIGLWRAIPRSRITLLRFMDGMRQIRIHMSVGHRLPMLVGAVGRAIAARLDLPAEELRRQFESLRWQVPLSFEDYLAQVAEARRLGYGRDDGNFAASVHTIAVTVQDEMGIVRYGISASTFMGQQAESSIKLLSKELIRLAEWSSIRLFGEP
jgi:DNA-binding IclR family transcriptional regulator